MAVVRALAAGLADLVLPRTCAGCGVPGDVLCRACTLWLARPRPARPRRHPPGLPPVVAAGAHAGPVRPALAAFKEHGRAELAGPLGAALALAVAAVLLGLPAPAAGPVLLVPFPPTAAALRARGRDPVRELAVRAARELTAAGATTSVLRALARRGRVRDSAGLGVAERRANLAGTLQLRPVRAVPPGAVLVVVDDVVTTGASLCAAVPVLEPIRSVTGTPLLAAALAATPPPRPSARPAAGDVAVRVRAAAGVQ